MCVKISNSNFGEFSKNEKILLISINLTEKITSSKETSKKKINIHINPQKYKE